MHTAVVSQAQAAGDALHAAACTLQSCPAWVPAATDPMPPCLRYARLPLLCQQSLTHHPLPLPPSELSRLHEGVEHVVRRVVQPQPPFEDAQLGPGRAPRVLLTCRPGVVMLGNGAHQPPTQVVVQEEVVACVQSDLAAMV